MGLFYVPSTKQELIIWLAKRYPECRSEYLRMDKKRLCAIYFGVNNKLRGLK